MTTHLKRAFGWNLGRVVPSPSELARLEAAGVKDPAAQRYAAWRRSLLLVALVPTLAVLLLHAADQAEEGLGALAPLGVAMEGAWWVAALALATGGLVGVRAWTRPGAGACLLRCGWIGAFLFPIVYAILPDGAVYGVDTHASTTSVDPEARLEVLVELVLNVLRSSGPILLLLPGVMSVIPGAVNGCLRIKSLLPAAQLPGWLLVSAAPMFLLLWFVLLVLVNQPLQSPLFVAGVVLWAGSPIVFTLRNRIFVQSQLSDADAGRIAGVKRQVALLAVGGLALVVVALFTAKVAGLSLVGFEEEAAVATRLAELEEADDEHLLEGLGDALHSSKSFAYALDLSSWQLLVDVLAKLLLATAVFADFVLRATLAAWGNDRALRSRAEASAFDEGAQALRGAVSGSTA